MGLTVASERAVTEQPSGLEARLLAAHLLKAVLSDKQPFDDAFSASSAKEPFAAMASRDRAFARVISAMSLRRRGQIEDILSRFLEKPLPSQARDAHLILVAATAQIIFLDVAPHAAISLAVDHAKSLRASIRYAGLINAVLRRVSREGPAVLAQQDAAQLNTPDWLYQRWVRSYGAETAAQIATAHMEEPPLDLSVTGDSTAWAERLGGIALSWGTVRLTQKGRIEDIEGYEDGGWWVQDAAAAIPALLLGDVKGLRIADLCAAPGGKTAQLAARGAHVTAIDISAGRVRRLRENLARLKLEAEVVVADAAAFAPPELFDAVLLDAPCSATGTIRRNPDIPYLKSEADITALMKVQERLLDAGLRLLKPGGRLVYCTCSLEPEEGEVQIARLLAVRDDLQRQPIEMCETNLPPDLVTPRGCLRTLPFHGMDGFFAVVLTRS